MHLLFLDESGTPPKPAGGKYRYFVIGGLIIPESEWHGLRDLVRGLKIRKRLRGELKWRYFAPDNDEEQNPMRKMGVPERNEIRTEIYTKIICGCKSVKSLACVCCAEAAYRFPSIVTQGDLYHGTYKPVSERFQYYLQDVSRSQVERGIIVCDHRGINDDLRLRKHHERLLGSGGDFISTYENLIEGIFLQPSNMSIGIQLADMVAGAVWRKFERGDERWFNLLKPSFRCSRIGSIDGYGLVKFPKARWV